MSKHQCDYCCWYTEERGCECPYVMRSTMCKKAIEAKDKADAGNSNIKPTKDQLYEAELRELKSRRY